MNLSKQEIQESLGVNERAARGIRNGTLELGQEQLEVILKLEQDKAWLRAWILANDMPLSSIARITLDLSENEYNIRT